MLLSEGRMSDFKGAALMIDVVLKAKALLGDMGNDADDHPRPAWLCNQVRRHTHISPAGDAVSGSPCGAPRHVLDKC